MCTYIVVASTESWKSCIQLLTMQAGKTFSFFFHHRVTGIYIMMFVFIFSLFWDCFDFLMEMKAHEKTLVSFWFFFFFYYQVMLSCKFKRCRRSWFKYAILYTRYITGKRSFALFSSVEVNESWSVWKLTDNNKENRKEWKLSWENPFLLILSFLHKFNSALLLQGKYFHSHYSSIQYTTPAGWDYMLCYINKKSKFQRQ